MGGAIDRRTFLAAAVATGVSLAVGSRRVGAAGARSPVPLTRLEQRAVVIGSGFGGGVAALRLAEAGVPVLVLERGLRWPTGPDAETFPHAARPDRRASWLCSPLVGALMPGNTAACNPSMTIAALAERAADELVARDVGTLI